MPWGPPCWRRAGPARRRRSTGKTCKRNRENGWALFGLGQALLAQGKSEPAAAVRARFEKAWARADVKLDASRFSAATAGH